jgi:hypothetical protein
MGPRPGARATRMAAVQVRGKREEADTHGLNPLIFSGQGTTTENKLIFGGQIQPPKVSGYFRRLRPGRRK